MRWYRIKRLLLAAAILLPLAMAACAVTETGNPCPGPGCPGSPAEPDSPDAAGVDAYTNDTYGVTIAYPSGWTVEESDGGDEVTFMAPDGFTSATVSFSILDPEPASLAVYLAQQYPTRTFTAYSTDAFDGFLYDNPTVGTNGGDLVEYFFLMDDVLIHVTAEVFLEDEDGLESLIDGIDSL